MRNSDTTLIIGARGRLGSALAGSTELGRVVALDRSVYASWIRPGAADDVSAFLDGLSIAPATTQILIASGVTDPALSCDDHHRINCVLPQNVVTGARRCGVKVASFGTIMELVAPGSSQNPYLNSKIRFAEFVRDASAADVGVVHIRLHTLYGGGPPARFMFLGQIRDAIASGTRFEMSEGTQLREYHHVDDEVVAIARLLQCAAGGILELSHGRPLRLRELAADIFAAFGRTDQLSIGARPMAEHENLHAIFERSPLLDGISFRDARTAIIDDLKTHIHR